AAHSRPSNITLLHHRLLDEDRHRRFARLDDIHRDTPIPAHSHADAACLVGSGADAGGEIGELAVIHLEMPRPKPDGGPFDCITGLVDDGCLQIDRTSLIPTGRNSYGDTVCGNWLTGDASGR